MDVCRIICDVKGEKNGVFESSKKRAQAEEGKRGECGKQQWKKKWLFMCLGERK